MKNESISEDSNVTHLEEFFIEKRTAIESERAERERVLGLLRMGAGAEKAHGREWYLAKRILEEELHSSVTRYDLMPNLIRARERALAFTRSRIAHAREYLHIKRGKPIERRVS